MPTGVPGRASGLGAGPAAGSVAYAAPMDNAALPSCVVVVGGGISGLAAAHALRAARPDAEVLVLEHALSSASS